MEAGSNPCRAKRRAWLPFAGAAVAAVAASAATVSARVVRRDAAALVPVLPSDEMSLLDLPFLPVPLGLLTMILFVLPLFPSNPQL